MVWLVLIRAPRWLSNIHWVKLSQAFSWYLAPRWLGNDAWIKNKPNLLESFVLSVLIVIVTFLGLLAGPPVTYKSNEKKNVTDLNQLRFIQSEGVLLITLTRLTCTWILVVLSSMLLKHFQWAKYRFTDFAFYADYTKLRRWFELTLWLWSRPNRNRTKPFKLVQFCNSNFHSIWTVLINWCSNRVCNLNKEKKWLKIWHFIWLYRNLNSLPLWALFCSV